MKKIASVTVGAGGSATISFTGIPSTYTDLCLIVSARSDAAVSSTTYAVRFNSATTGYNMPGLQGSGTAVSAPSASTLNQHMPGASATANVFGNATFYVLNYGLSAWKLAIGDSVTENNASAAVQFAGGGWWTGSAVVDTVTLVPASGNFVQNSIATLYGITKGSGGATVS